MADSIERFTSSATRQRPRSRIRWLLAGLFVLVAVLFLWRESLYVVMETRRIEQLAETVSPDDARSQARQLLIRFPRQKKALLLSARLERITDHLAEARETLRQLQQIEGDSPRVRFERELIEIQSGNDPALATRLMQTLTTSSQISRDTCEAYARGLLKRLQIQPALNLIEAWQKDYSTDATPFALKGEIYDGLMQLAPAEESLHAALARQPRRKDLRLRLSQILLRMNRPSDAEREVRRIAEPQQLDIQSQLTLARAVLDQGNVADADAVLDELERSITNPLNTATDDANSIQTNEAIKALRGEHRLMQGRVAEAVRILREVTSNNARDVDLRYLLAKALQQMGHRDEASEHFKYFQEAQGPLNELAQLTLQIGERQNDVSLRVQIARILLKYGSVEDGVRWLHSALALDPHHPDAQRLLAEYKHQNDSLKANGLPKPMARLSESQPKHHLETKRKPTDESHTTVLSPAANGQHKPRWKYDDAPAGTIHFLDETRRTGISFTAQTGSDRHFGTMLEIVGCGIGLIDLDRDGNLDLVAAGGGDFKTIGSNSLKASGTESDSKHASYQIVGKPNAAFLNRGNWQFEDVSVFSGLATANNYSHGVIAGDCNNDGFVDLLLTGFPGVCLFQNNGDGTFSDITISSRLAESGWVTAAAWGDLNADGTADLVLVRYVDWTPNTKRECIGTDGHKDACPPRDFGTMPDSLFLADGQGNWIESSNSGLRTDGKGLGVIVTDLDDDGDNDIHIANDTTANFLYRNEGTLPLVETGLESGIAFDAKGVADGSMGCEILDADGNGQLDLFVTNFERGVAAIYRQFGPLQFSHDSAITGLAAETGRYVGWGIAARDLDGDGDHDLLFVNGHSNRAPSSGALQPAQIFENRQGERFYPCHLTAGSYFQTLHNGRGLAVGDLDGDGRDDVVISHANQPLSILRNDSNKPTNWVSMELIGTGSAREAVGARVSAESNGFPRMAVITGGGTYLSSHSRRITFSIQQSSEQQSRDTVSVTVKWPGRREEFFKAKMNELNVLIENRGSQNRPSLIR